MKMRTFGEVISEACWGDKPVYDTGVFVVITM